MPLLLLKNLPRYDCLLEAAREFPDLDPSACDAYLHLLRTGDEAFRVIGSNLASHGMSSGRFMVLMLLLDKKNWRPLTTMPTPAELAEKAGVTRATMTGLIDTLERDGLVKREPDPEDRRRMLVQLTAPGHSALMGILPGHFQRMTGLMRTLSEAERKALVRLLDKVAEQAARIAPPSRTVGTIQPV